MSDHSAISYVVNIIKRKWIIIILTGVLFSVLFMGFKYSTKDSYTLAPNGDVYIAEVIKINNYPDQNDTLKYDKYFASTTYLYSFYKSSKDTYDYEKLSPGWKNKTDSQKLEWMNKHLIVKYFGAGRVEISLDIKKSDAMDLAYLNNHGKEYVDSFVSFLNSKDTLGEYQVVDTIESIPENLTINNKNVIVKYGIIGFVLGIAFMTTVMLIYGMRKNYNGKF